jgi:hypothetical protein
MDGRSDNLVQVSSQPVGRGSFRNDRQCTFKTAAARADAADFVARYLASIDSGLWQLDERSGITDRDWFEHYYEYFDRNSG